MKIERYADTDGEPMDIDGRTHSIEIGGDHYSVSRETMIRWRNQLAAAIYESQPPCPDGGRCHHECLPLACYRVRCCAPLSGVYPNDDWPDEVRAEHWRAW